MHLYAAVRRVINGAKAVLVVRSRKGQGKGGKGRIRIKQTKTKAGMSLQPFS